MCGIAGIVGGRDKDDSIKNTKSMLEALKHRGPNDEGLHAWGSAAFGHRRLSIFDLSSAGHQPMLSSDGEIGIVLKGAIYNFRPLRREIEAWLRFESE